MYIKKSVSRICTLYKKKQSFFLSCAFYCMFSLGCLGGVLGGIGI